MDTSMKQLDTSSKSYNMWNLRATTKQLHARIKTKKRQVYMILRVMNRIQAHLKRKKRHGMVRFVSINEVKNLHFNLITCVCSTEDKHKQDKINVGVIQFRDKGIMCNVMRLASVY